MNLSTFPRSLPARRRALQSGIGLLQVMLVLLLVATALAAAAVLVQSKRAPSQAVTQERTLRWADEAIAAFAAANARLPCPADTANGEENCAPGHAKGWLPARTLLGASGSDLPPGPVAYMVYRGDETLHLDLTAPGNAYQPPLIDGSPRQIVDQDGVEDEDGKLPSRAFASINGLDLCRSLELAQRDPYDATRAHADGVPANMAYGIAAAGPLAGATRLDGANSGPAAQLASPWQQWDSGYDDRVRVRTFDAAGQMLGCRLLGDLAGSAAAAHSALAPFSATALAAVPSGNEPFNVSIAGMDVLAAAVTLHDALAALQANNIDATESAVSSATKAQISLVFKLVTTAASLSDQITTLVTSAANLTRSIATCIASLGAMCWEVPLKTAAVVTSIIGLGEKGVTLAAKAAALPFVALALDASLKARDLARKAGPVAPPKNIEEARKQLECTLYARNCEDPTEWEVVYKRDKNGNPIPRRDAAGNPLYDEHGNPLYEEESRSEVPRVGLDTQVEIAKAEWQKLQYQVDMLEQWRLAPWGVAVQPRTDALGAPVLDGNGLPTHETVEITSRGVDGAYRSQAQQRIHPQRTCNLGSTSTDWKNCTPQRYRKTVETWVCKHVGANQGEYDEQGEACVHVGTETLTVDGEETTRPAGAYDRVKEISYAFDWDVATNDLIARRRAAEHWTDLNMREQELKKEIEQFQDNLDTWFKGGDAIYRKMLNQLDDEHHCDGKGLGSYTTSGWPNVNLPAKDMQKQQCINARSAVRYIDTCEKPITVNECRYVGSDAGRYSDSACTDRNGTPKDYGWQETSSGDYAKDDNSLATCRPNMLARLAGMQEEYALLDGKRNEARAAYQALPSPWVAYPSRTQPYAADGNYDWFEWAIETTEDKHGNPLTYDWVRTRFSDNYTYTYTYTWDCSTETETKSCSEQRSEVRTRSLPWYAREPYNAATSQSSPVLVTGNLELMNKDLCRFFAGRVWQGTFWGWPGSGNADWWGNTYPMGLYCQRYPYNRAFEDWRRAKLGAENARKNHDDTRKRFEELEEELENMRDGAAPGGGPTTQMSFGAEAALEHADSRGSTGPQAVVQP
ncbi:hypothetical protein [Stenotrophomonas mori]|uniref:Type IV secretion protein Rhs n=1 Tax=Stenotrophomonas mori TaxID=2871096 RepID=A0ABT0SII0_9GAMM|nr:hypothetical protein [Stenotrophomonas mori]MCL7715148.1 hypothetical protein [Stenotrophomonas mori]